MTTVPPATARMSQVMIVEDDPSQRLTLTDILTDEGLTVVSCGCAREAIDLLRVENIAVAIVDYKLPDASGTQLLDRLRAFNPAIRVIIYTGYGSFESARDAVNLGAFAYVEKLHAPDELIATVHRALEEYMVKALEESQGRLRSIAENAPDRIIQLDRDGKIIFSNRAIEGLDLDHDASAYDMLPPQSHELLRTALEKVFATGQAEQFEAAAPGREGAPAWYDTRLGPVIIDGQVTSVVLIAHDISARKQAEQALAARVHQQAVVGRLGQGALSGMSLSQLMREAVEQLAQMLNVEWTNILELTPRGDKMLLIAGTGWQEGIVGQSTVDSTPNTLAGYALHCREPVVVQNWQEDGRFEPSPSLMLHKPASSIAVVIAGGERPYGVLCVHTASPRIFSKDDVHFVQSIANVLADAVQQSRTAGALRESELHYRQAAESNRRLLHEVNHRVRNNLGGLMSLLSLTRQRATDVQDFAAAMESRVKAMVRTHNLLADSGWRPLDLGTLISNLLTHTSETSPHNITVNAQGPPTPISPRQSVPLAMSLMEMFTNSCKHGAHRSPEGQLHIHWEQLSVLSTDAAHRSAGRDGHWVRLIWRESGGPIITGPIKPSLGTELIQGFVTFELGGACQLQFPPQGVHHIIEFQIDDSPTVVDPPPRQPSTHTA